MAITTATATFTGAEDSVAVTWSGITATTPVVTSGICISDSPLGNVDVDVTGVSSSGCTVVPSERFAGTVELVVSDQ